jgi:hypothetical protein
LQAPYHLVLGRWQRRVALAIHFIEELIEELAAVLGRGRYDGDAQSDATPPSGNRHSHLERQFVGSFGPLEMTA